MRPDKNSRRPDRRLQTILNHWKRVPMPTDETTRTSATYAYAHLWLRRGLVGRLHDASAAPRLLLTRARHAKPSRTRSPTPSPHEFPFPSPSRLSRDAVAGLAAHKTHPPAPIQQSPLLAETHEPT